MEKIVLKSRDALHVTAILINDVSIYSKKTEQEFLDEGCIVLPSDEACKIIHKNENKKYLTEWKEITEDEWWNALEVLPPMNRKRINGYGFFFCSEAYTGNIHSCYCDVGGRFFTTKRRTSQTYESMIDEIAPILQRGE